MSIQDVSAITSSIEIATLLRSSCLAARFTKAVSRPASMLLISTVSLADVACAGSPRHKRSMNAASSNIATGKGTTSSTGERRSVK